MKYKWLNKKNNKNLIIFFNGWGMDESIVNHLAPDNFDVLMFYDYNSLNTEFDFQEIQYYKDKYLIAWSMGVMIGTLFDIKYKKKVAINGTLKPIDDKYGIPYRIYNLTLNGFSEAGVKHFIKSMFNNECELPLIHRLFEEQKSELEALTHYTSNFEFKYDKVIISSNDKIIPTKNQEEYWKIKSNLNSGHAPFYKFRKWKELI